MLSKSAFWTLTTACVAVPSLILFLCARSARAQNSSANYTFVVASGFLCDPGTAVTCPAVAKSADGDSYEINGAGTFNAQNKSVKAAGTFTHKSANGNVLQTGVWIASELDSFVPYGVAPGAFLREKIASGPLQFAPKRSTIFTGPIPTGGLAVFRILLLPMSGATRTAILQVNCALGKVPAERQIEGIRLSLERNGSEFSEEASGRVMFLSMRPAGTSERATPDSVEAP